MNFYTFFLCFKFSSGEKCLLLHGFRMKLSTLSLPFSVLCPGNIKETNFYNSRLLSRATNGYEEVRESLKKVPEYKMSERATKVSVC